MPKVLNEMIRFFRDREKESRTQSDRALRRHNQISILRVVVFVLGVSIVVYWANERAGYFLFASLAIFIAIFAYLILLHRNLFENALVAAYFLALVRFAVLFVDSRAADSQHFSIQDATYYM